MTHVLFPIYQDVKRDGSFCTSRSMYLRKNPVITTHICQSNLVACLPLPLSPSWHLSSGTLQLVWRVCTSLSSPVWADLVAREREQMVQRSGDPQCCWWMTSVCCWVWGWALEPCWTLVTTAEPPSAPSYRFDSRCQSLIVLLSLDCVKLKLQLTWSQCLHRLEFFVVLMDALTFCAVCSVKTVW